MALHWVPLFQTLQARASHAPEHPARLPSLSEIIYLSLGLPLPQALPGLRSLPSVPLPVGLLAWFLEKQLLLWPHLQPDPVHQAPLNLPFVLWQP